MKFETLDKVEKLEEEIDTKEYVQSNRKIQLFKYLYSKLLRNKNLRLSNIIKPKGIN